MANPLLSVLAYTLIPIATTVVGGMTTIFWTLEPRLKSAILHFAAGVVLVAVTVELLPDVMREHQPIPVFIGFTLGTALMLLLRWLSQRLEQAGIRAAGLPIGVIGAVAIDLLLDGLLVGIGFAAGMEEGILLTIAIAIENFFVGMSTSLELREASMTRSGMITTTVLLALAVAVGAEVGVTLLAGLTGFALAAVLSFGAAALLYLVIEELIVEADQGPEPLFATAMFFVGFLLFFVLSMISTD